MKSFSLFAAASCVAAILLGRAASAPASAPAERIGSDAVWSPPADFVSRFHSACDALRGSEFDDCLFDATGEFLGTAVESVRRRG